MFRSNDPREESSSLAVKTVIYVHPALLAYCYYYHYYRYVRGSTYRRLLPQFIPHYKCIVRAIPGGSRPYFPPTLLITTDYSVCRLTRNRVVIFRDSKNNRNLYDFNCSEKSFFSRVHSYGFIENVWLSRNCIQYVYITGERAWTSQFIIIYIVLYMGILLLRNNVVPTHCMLYPHTFYVHNLDWFFILVNRKSDIVSTTAIGMEKTVFYLERVDINNKFFFILNLPYAHRLLRSIRFLLAQCARF